MAAVVIREVDGWPLGESLEDLTEYTMTQGAEGYDVHEVRHCRCAKCGGQVFGLRGDLEIQAAQRICRGCGDRHFIADSGGHWADAKPGIMVCECGGDGDEEDFNLAVGFSLYADPAGVRALSITSHCVACGRLGYWDDWMIRGGDPRLLDLA